MIGNKERDLLIELMFKNPNAITNNKALWNLLIRGYTNISEYDTERLLELKIKRPMIFGQKTDWVWIMTDLFGINIIRLKKPYLSEPGLVITSDDCFHSLEYVSNFTDSYTWDYIEKNHMGGRDILTGSKAVTNFYIKKKLNIGCTLDKNSIPYSSSYKYSMFLVKVKKKKNFFFYDNKILANHKPKGKFSLNIYKRSNQAHKEIPMISKSGWLRIESAYAGKGGHYSGARRKKNSVYMFWFIYMFKIVLLTHRRFGLKKNKIKFGLMLTIRNIFTKFLSCLNKISGCINKFNSTRVAISIENNWRCYNIKFKKSRYLKKFKRSSILKKDLYSRKKYL